MKMIAQTNKLFYNISVIQIYLFSLLLVSHSLKAVFQMALQPRHIIIPAMLFLFILKRLFSKTDIIVNTKKELLIVMLFAIVLAYSLFWGLFGSVTAIEKTIDLLIIFLFFLIGNDTIKDIKNRHSVSVKTVVVISVIHSVLMIFRPEVYYKYGEINYLLLTMSVSFGAILSVIKFFNNNHKLIYRGLYLISYLIIIYAVSLTHSRANLILLILVFLLFILRNLIKGRNLSVLFVVLFSLLFFVNNLLSFFMESSPAIQRLINFTENNYSDPRENIISVIKNNYDTFKFTGFGPGGTEELLMSTVNQPYPHNFFLEFFTEFGVIGLLLVVYMIYFLINLFLVKVNWKNENQLILSVCLIFLLALYMKSFSIYNSYEVFFLMGALASLSNFKTTIKND